MPDPLPESLLLRDPRTRRSFLRVAGVTGVGAGATLLAACRGMDGRGSSVPAGGGSGRSDARLLNAALELEHTAIAAYTAIVPLLRGPARAAGRRFREHDREHAARLTRDIDRLGGTPVKTRTRDEYMESLPRLASQSDALAFAVDMENTAVAAYADAVPRLSSTGLRRTAAAIMSTQAQHAAVMRGVLHGERPASQVPAAFVTGREA